MVNCVTLSQGLIYAHTHTHTKYTSLWGEIVLQIPLFISHIQRFANENDAQSQQIHDLFHGTCTCFYCYMHCIFNEMSFVCLCSLIPVCCSRRHPSQNVLRIHRRGFFRKQKSFRWAHKAGLPASR